MTRWRDLSANEMELLQARIRNSARLAKAGIAQPSGPDDGDGSPQPQKRPRGRPRAPQVAESPILHDCLAYLNLHPAVAFAFRANTGLVTTPDGARRFKAGFRGCSDILGMLKGRQAGRFLAVEIKRPEKHPTAAQQNFLDRVNRAGGLAFVATSVRDCQLSLRSD